MIEYAAFGSNMDPVRVLKRGVDFTNRQAVTLPGWELRFNKRMRTDPRLGTNPQFGAANIEERAGGVVEAIVYTVSPAGILKLDYFEGFPNHYTRQLVTVVDKGGLPHKAVTYTAHPDHTHPEDLPVHPDYLQFLLNAREDLSPGYVRRLEALRPASAQEVFRLGK